jgi:L-fucose isomerase-like protein
MQKRAKLPNGYWKILGNCKAEALKYSSRSEWQKDSPLSYRWATKNKWVEECAGHMTSTRMPDGYWTLERCQEMAKNYTTKAQWRLLWMIWV